MTGFLEPGVLPLEQAMTEIAEETGLDAPTVRLVGAPEPLRMERPSQGWVWVDLPVPLRDDSPSLRLDWEHDEYRWIDPAELDASDCVPWIRDVWIALGALDALASQAGSADLTARAARARAMAARRSRVAAAGSGALKTALTTATESAPAANAAARFSAVIPPMPTIGKLTRRRASTSISGPAGSASGLVGVLNSAPKPM